MAEFKTPERPPDEFMAWLEKNYSWVDVWAWKQNNQVGIGWKSDPVFEYWSKKVYPLSQYPGVEIKPSFTTLKPSDEVKQKPVSANVTASAASATDIPKEIKANLDNLLKKGKITPEQYNQYLENFGGGGLSSIGRYELQQRLDTALKAIFNNPYIPESEKSALMSSEGQKLQEAYLSGKQKENLEEYLDAMYARGVALYEKSVEKERSYNARLDNMGRPNVNDMEPWELPPLPAERKVSTPFLESTGLASGTRLRSYIAGEIDKIRENVRPEREEWWGKINAPSDRAKPSLESVEGQLTEESDVWGNMAKSGAPATEWLGNTYWGEGGLQKFAEQAYARARRKLGELNTEDFPDAEALAQDKPPAPPEDPFVLALRKRQKTFKPEYFRQPGTGLFPRLTPSVHF